MARMRKRFLDTSKLTLEQATSFGEGLATQQRDVMWQLGDLARYCETRWPELHYQCWPDWVSPNLLARAAAVAKAYPKEEDREHNCTWSQYMQVANRSDRHERLAAIEEAGLTTDESRSQEPPETRPRWLLACDINFYLHKWWYSGAGLESAMGVCQYIERTVGRLQDKGLTDCVCAFDSPVNHRKTLTEDWEDRYKDRPPKDQELRDQLHLVEELLDKAGFCCHHVDGMEADDVMASFAAQFPQRVTLLTADKDCRQCLGGRVNILRDVEWNEDDTTGEHTPTYHWVSAKSHTEETGIPPRLWTDWQCIAGDSADNVKGVSGIGKKGATDLLQQYGDLDRLIRAAECGDQRIKVKKREALVEFKPKLEVTRQLVTLRTDLDLPPNTSIV